MYTSICMYVCMYVCRALSLNIIYQIGTDIANSFFWNYTYHTLEKCDKCIYIYIYTTLGINAITLTETATIPASSLQSLLIIFAYIYCEKKIILELQR